MCLPDVEAEAVGQPQGCGDYEGCAMEVVSCLEDDGYPDGDSDAGEGGLRGEEV